MVAAKLNGQTIEKRKSVDSTENNSNGGVVTIKKAANRMPSRKLEPLAQDNQ